MRVNLLRRAGPATGAALIIARVCQLERAAAEALVNRLGVLPRGFDSAEAAQVVEALRAAMVQAEVIEGPATAQRRCVTHGSLEASASCDGCGHSICVVCMAAAARPKCAPCVAKERRARAFRNLRVVLLMLVLVGVGLWGLARQFRLDRRTQWRRPLVVSVVLVTRTQPTSSVVERWSTSTEALTTWFTREWNRYRAPVDYPPVRFVLEPVAVVDVLPEAPSDAQGAVTLERSLDAIDAQVGMKRNDATVYVALSADSSSRVEGIGEAGGLRGLIFAGAQAGDITLESVALAHELLHCLGALDKYDEAGHAVRPQGLPAPEQEPLFPQRAGEVMVGEVATGPASGEPIRTLDQAEIGPVTAREIKW